MELRRPRASAEGSGQAQGRATTASATAAAFCKADAAFLCLACNASACKLALRHEHSWMCERAPATFVCKADTAALCAVCDADVHSTNPLAIRHVRVPLDPFFDMAAAAGLVTTGSVPEFLATPANGMSHGVCRGAWGWREEDEEEAKSWLLLNLTKITKGAEAEAGDSFWNEVDRFLEFEGGGSVATSVINNECLVPVQANVVNPPVTIRYPHQSGKCFDIDFSTSGDLSPLSQSLSTSLDFGVVPDENSTPEAPCSDRAAHPLNGADHKAWVLRYRGKKEEPAVREEHQKPRGEARLASRKANAEVRLRIKGQFTRRGLVLEREEDESIAVNVHGIRAEVEYGVVPTFSHVPIN